MAWATVGPGTLTYTIDGGTAEDFSIEVKSGGINHSYEDIGESTTYLDGTTDGAGQQRVDSATFDCDFDLGSAGYYNWLNTNDGAVATLTYTPHTSRGAKWTGSVKVRLPDGAVAEGYGSKISGTVEHTFIDKATFTPDTAAP